MSVSYRDVVLPDAPMIADLFARSFVETFGHLYRKRDLDTFLNGVTADAFAQQIANPDFALRVAEVAGEPVGFAKLGPASLPIETPPGTLELWQIYVLKPWQGQGVAQQQTEAFAEQGVVIGDEDAAGGHVTWIWASTRWKPAAASRNACCMARRWRSAL